MKVKVIIKLLILFFVSITILWATYAANVITSDAGCSPYSEPALVQGLTQEGVLYSYNFPHPLRLY